MNAFLVALDVLGVLSALLAAWLWYLSGRRRIRRISRFEVLNHADINRIVTSLNRSNLLNRRAAFAAGASALALAIRFAVDAIRGL
jgi:hypothetical protein